MGYYHTQQVCLNGHKITTYYDCYPEFRKDFCGKCGEKTIHQCPDCSFPIPGSYSESVGKVSVPSNCNNCGKQYPWTKKKAVEAMAVKGKTADPLLFVEKICSRFHLVSKQLRSRREDRDTLIVEDEYDVQDLLHALLKIYFDDIRDEEWTPSYAGGASRVDFLLKNEQIIIEVKKTRRNLKAKQVGDQLIIDIQRYQAHPDCKALFCFVYDPDGWIANPQGLENDLNKETDELKVKVLIVPKGY